MDTPRTFHAGKFELPLPEVEALRTAYLSDTAPQAAIEASAASGWIEVNRHYLHEQQQLGERCMRALMAKLGVSSVRSSSEAMDLVELALHVFSPPEGYRGATVRTGPDEMRIVNPYCPIYSAFEERDWQGVTACPSWYIRRGWLDALGVNATDSVVAEKQWGNPTCAAVLRVEAPSAVHV